jgi:hypothetical protein
MESIVSAIHLADISHIVRLGLRKIAGKIRFFDELNGHLPNPSPIEPLAKFKEERKKR